MHYASQPPADRRRDPARLDAPARLSIPRKDGTPSVRMAKNDEFSSGSDGIAPGEGTALAARFQALLSVAKSITSCREPEELFGRLAGELQRAVRVGFIGAP